MQDVPVAKANPADIQDLLGGALFKALYKWMQESGPVYLLPTGTVWLRHKLIPDKSTQSLNDLL